MSYLDLGTRIEMLATGNELLDGSISDTHTKTVGASLRSLGLRLARATVIGDDARDLQSQLVAAGSRSRVVVVTGGLGPTVDDLTLEVAAKTFGSVLVVDSAAKKNVENLLKRHRRQANEGHKKMMLIPKGSKALWNKEGTAPAVRWDVGDRTFFFLPGVPREFVFCYEQHVLPFLKSLAPKEGDHLFILKVLGWPESVLDQMLRKMRWPVGVDVGFRTSLPENHIKILVRARSRAAAFKKIHKQVKSIQKKIGSALFSTNADESFGEIFLRDLLSKRHRLVTAESCTGGLVSSIVTAIPGSSDAFERGFVVYSNQSKQDLLGVSEKTLQQQGAVSEACVHELLDGVFKRTQATCGIAISGIAGPSGGTKKKPVGSIWIAAGTRKKRRTKLLQLGFSRELNQKFSAYAALQMLRELI